MHLRELTVFLFAGIFAAWPDKGIAADPELRRPGDTTLAEYFRHETKSLASACLTEIHSLEDWVRQRSELRRELFEMLGLDPLPVKTDLRPVITGTVEGEDFVVEKLHFQSMPGLYVTGNLYLPRGQSNRVPAVLYVCGHANVTHPVTGVPLGNKTAYQHHGEWFARHGYVCLTLDTIQLGEIKGLHHGTYREGMWWWNARGYTPAGVEAWNCIRALDYLESRPEVDGGRIGVTGRSGGGAYSWWVAALDDRIRVAAPVAGITDLENHVIDGTVAGHCDCMFMVNTYRWDYPTVAALIAPRPLLIANSDKDSIFPLNGVVRLHAKVAEIYRLYGATNNLGLLITEGPHRDTQDLQVPVFRWFNRFLKGTDPLIQMAATPLLKPEQLQVFTRLPEDERTSSIHESFVPQAANMGLPANAREWSERTNAWRKALQEKVFRAWPSEPTTPEIALKRRAESQSGTLELYDLVSQNDVKLPLYVTTPRRVAARVRFKVLGEGDWASWVDTRRREFPAIFDREASSDRSSDRFQPEAPGATAEGEIEVVFAPRGVGPSAWNPRPEEQIQIRRRFMLLGQTLDGMRVWDIRRALQSSSQLRQCRGLPILLEAEGNAAVNGLYAALFEPGLDRLILKNLPRSHRQGPDYLNILRFLDIPQTVAMVSERTVIELAQSGLGDWSYPSGVATQLGWSPERIQVRVKASAGQ